MALAVANISEILDSRDIGAFQKGVVALCAAIAFVDGIEGQLAGYIAPALRADWGLSPRELGVFLASGPLGLLFGGLLHRTSGRPFRTPPHPARLCCDVRQFAVSPPR